MSILYFFFQAEDGIRDYKVTGVQTCALPIFPAPDGREERSGRPARAGRGGESAPRDPPIGRPPWRRCPGMRDARGSRSEERRVGRAGGRWGWAQEHGNDGGSSVVSDVEVTEM